MLLTLFGFTFYGIGLQWMVKWCNSPFRIIWVIMNISHKKFLRILCWAYVIFIPTPILITVTLIFGHTKHAHIWISSFDGIVGLICMDQWKRQCGVIANLNVHITRC